MIPRYSRPEMAAIWEPANKFRIWFEIEAHACDALADLGVIPKKAAKAIPRSNTQTPKNGRAKKAAGVTLIIVRTKLMIIRAAIISVGRSGLINNCPRLRAHISSTNVSDRPRFERNRTSHNNTALMRAPAAWANQELCCKKNVVINPHSKSWKVGQ